MPIIFAQAIMFAPSYVGRLIGNNEVGQWIQVNFSDIFGLWYNIVFGLLIIIFTFFTQLSQYQQIKCQMI